MQKKIKASYSLIELSIALAVMGIVVTAAIVNISPYFNIAKLQETRSNVDLSAKFLMEYAANNSYLPCPANPGNDDYVETMCSCSSMPKENMVCGSSDNFVVGALPVISISGGKIRGVDAWGYKLIYMVSSKLTRPNSNATGSLFVDVSGNLDNLNKKKLIEVAFIVFSAGIDHLGAWNKDGMVSCDSTDLSKIIDKNNCSFARKDFSLMYFPDIRVKNGKVKVKDSKGENVYSYNNIVSWGSMADYNLLFRK